MSLATEAIQSFRHPLEVFGYTAHALMVPPYAPRTVLMLGYGLGNVHRLIEIVWGQVNMTGVDLALPDCDLSDVTFVQQSASRFVHEYKGEPFDFVVVDLFNGRRIPEFVFHDSFASEVKGLTGKLLAINLTFHDWKVFKNFGKYFDVDCVKTVNCGRDLSDEDRVMFMIPKGADNGEEEAAQT